MAQQFFRYRVEPYREEEYPRCACCGKRMTVRFAESIALLPAGNQPETGLRNGLPREEEYTTNRRITHRTTEWGYRYTEDSERGPYRGKPSEYEERKWERVPYVVRLTFYNDRPERWGSDGLFCTSICAIAFAHAALRAGYRIKSKDG